MQFSNFCRVLFRNFKLCLIWSRLSFVILSAIFFSSNLSALKYKIYIYIFLQFRVKEIFPIAGKCKKSAIQIIFKCSDLPNNGSEIHKNDAKFCFLIWSLPVIQRRMTKLCVQFFLKQSDKFNVGLQLPRDWQT